jgi:hypothetical protein
VPDGALPLTSVTRRRVVWGPSLTARCKPSDTGTPVPWFPTLDNDHDAPQASCTCGIYGWYAPTDTGMVSARVFGVVEASGLILMGDRGFRAQTVKIAAVVTRNRRITTACTRAGIPVYHRRRDLLRDYPPEDLSPLVGNVREHGPPPAAPPQGPLLFDGLACLAVWGRAALVAAALVLLPTAPALTVAGSRTWRRSGRSSLGFTTDPASAAPRGSEAPERVVTVRTRCCVAAPQASVRSSGSK